MLPSELRKMNSGIPLILNYGKLYNYFIIYHNVIIMRASMVAQMVKNLTAMQETWVQSLGREDSLEKGMAYPLQYSGLEIIETKYTIHVRNENDPKTVPTHLSPCKKCLPLNWPLVLKKLGSTAVSYENGMEARVGGVLLLSFNH